MKQARKFRVNSGWAKILQELDINSQQVLSYAELPADLFYRQQFSLEQTDYLRLCKAIEFIANGKPVPLLFGKNLQLGDFQPCLLAFVCCRNLEVAAHRYAEYRSMHSPVRLQITRENEWLTLDIECSGVAQLPSIISLPEMVLLTRLARLASKTRLGPISVELQTLPEQAAAYEQFFKIRLIQSNRNRIRFSARDAQMPFLSDDPKLWEFFEPSIRKTPAEEIYNLGLVERLRNLLLEMLPGGQHSIEYAAKRMAISKRTLQRKLKEESLSYLFLLNEARETLACHYLRHSEIVVDDIAFLLGFNDTNSFYRAFMRWTGMSPESYKNSVSI